MCGIAGALAPRRDAPPPAGAAQRFAAAMVHRGPDGHGFYDERSGGARPPAALDHRPVGGGPPADDQRGRADRDRGQRRDLQPRRAAPGARGQGAPLPQRQRLRGGRAPLRGGRRANARAAARDVRVRASGTGARTRCCSRAIASAKSRSTTASARTGSCSRPSSARCSPTSGRPPTISLPALDAYLALQYVPSPDTIYEGLKKLPAGHTLEVRCGERPVVRRYYRPSFAPTLAPSVRARGGRARARGGRGGGARPPDVGRPARRVSVGRDRLVDRRRLHGAGERRAGQDVLGRLLRRGARRQRAALRAPRRRALPDRAPRAGGRAGHGGPAARHRPPSRRAVRRHVGGADPLPLRADPPARHGRAVRRRRRRGVRRLPPLRLGARRGPHPAPARRPLARRGRAGALAAVPGGRARWLREYGARLSADEATRYLRFICHFSAAEKGELYTPELRARFARDATAEAFAARLAASAATDTVGRLQNLDAETYLPDDILAKVDVASMAHGLEARAPFVDHHVMELGAALPGRLKLRHGKGKHILKQAFADLVPAEIVEPPQEGVRAADRALARGAAARLRARPAALARGARARAVRAGGGRRRCSIATAPARITASGSGTSWCSRPGTAR